MHPVNQLPEILAATQLQAAYDWVAQHNPSNNMPYHNLHHTQGMAVNCYYLGLYAQLPYDDLRALVMAALFHDFGHSGGVSTDAENIQVALVAFRAFAGETGLADAETCKVVRLIEATQFPYVRDIEDELDAIIRDADQLQLTMDGWYTMLFQGLRQEFSHKMGAMDLPAFCALQRKYLPTVKYHSQWGQTYAQDVLQMSLSRVAVVEGLVSLMTRTGCSQAEAEAQSLAKQVAVLA